MRTRVLLAAAVMIAVSAANRAENPPTPPKPQLVTKVFQVADLVIPIPDQVGGERPATPEPTKPVLSERLIQCVTDTIRPLSWKAKGGPGKIEFVEKGYALIVTNSPAAVEEVRDLLEAMQRLHNTNISFEVRVITVAADQAFGECPAKEGEVAFLTDAQLKKALEALQADRRVNVLQAPKVTTFNGQEAVVKITDQQFFVTGLEAQRVKGQVLLVPKTTPFELGMTLALRGQFSADKKFVAVNASYIDKRLEGSVPMIPVVTQIPPVSESGVQGKSIPFTQYLQAPQIETVKIERKDLVIASGGCAVIPGPTFLQESREETRVPVLAEIPYVNRLFKKVGYSKTTMRTILVVSPRVIELVEEAPKVDPKR